MIFVMATNDFATSTSSTGHGPLQPLQQAAGHFNPFNRPQATSTPSTGRRPLQSLQQFGHFPLNPYLCLGNMKQMKGTVPFPSLFHRRWQQKKKQFR
jgi:hypothetical protein